LENRTIFYEISSCQPHLMHQGTQLYYSPHKTFV
jgi:hypothetical protein